MATIPFNFQEAVDNGFFVSGTTQSGKSTLSKWIVQKIIDNGANAYILDVSKVWTQCAPISNVIDVPSNVTEISIPSNQSAVIDLSNLDYIKRINYVIAFCKCVYNWHKDKGFKRAPIEFLIFEEAHSYFANGCFRNPRQFSPCVDLITIGANFNLRFGVITQFPASLDKALVKVSQQRFFGWSTEKNDLDYIKAFVGKEYTKPDNPNSVFNLQKGQFLYQLRNKIEKIQSSPYVEPKPGFTLNGQSVNFNYFV